MAIGGNCCDEVERLTPERQRGGFSWDRKHRSYEYCSDEFERKWDVMVEWRGWFARESRKYTPESR